MSYTIYSKPSCSQCDQAKMLLTMKEKTFTVKMLDVDYSLEDLKEKVPSAKSFPVIFKESEYLGSLLELRKELSKNESTS